MAETAKGQSSGLATLDADGDVPVTQIPDEVTLDAEVGALAALDAGVAVADPAALTAAAAAGAAPDDDEFDALLADVTEVRAQLVALIASLTDAGVLAAGE